MLDYWVRSRVIEPTRVFVCKMSGDCDMRQRSYNLFDFATLVQIRIVKDMRDSGVALQRIRYAIERLRKMTGRYWQSTWLMTDGRNVVKATNDSSAVESLRKGEKGQLCFSIVAMAETAKDVQAQLKRCKPFRVERYEGRLELWSARVVSG